MSGFLSILKCSKCGHEEEPNSHPSPCPHCGGVVVASYNLEGIRSHLTTKKLERRPPGVWRYFELLPLTSRANIVSLGEGGTFLHRCNRLAEHLGLEELYLKDETFNPTGSFIDRGMTVEVSMAQEAGFSAVSGGGSGNLAASLVAYAARAGLATRIFLPQRIDVGKLYQIIAYNPDVDVMSGPNEEARFQRGRGKTYSVATRNLGFQEGLKTTGYEICEQLGWSYPTWIIVPMGNGCHLSMIWKGLKEFHQMGFAAGEMPRLVGTQAKGCDPIVEAFRDGLMEVRPSGKFSTVALDICMRNPSCGFMALQALRQSGGLALSVSDDRIIRAVGLLARMEGVFAEPASATTIAVLEELVKRGVIGRDDSVVCVITGMGLKYPEVAHTLAQGRKKLKQLLSRVERRKFATKLGETKMAILRILAREDLHGYGIWRTLGEEFGVKMSIPAVYQHLSDLKRSHLVIRTRSVPTHRGTLRHYYALTEKGRWILKQMEGLGI